MSDVRVYCGGAGGVSDVDGVVVEVLVVVAVLVTQAGSSGVMIAGSLQSAAGVMILRLLLRIYYLKDSACSQG